MKLALIVPCFNEQDNVENFFDEVNRVFSGKVDDYGFVFVDDGSSDGTYSKLESIYEKSNKNVQVISFSRNFGKEAAIYAGLNESDADMVCLIDADLQQRPETVLEMLDVLESNSELDCVTAYQKNRKEGKLISSMKSTFYKIINNIAEVDFVNGASDFRLLRRGMVDAILQMTEYHRFSKGIFSWVGFKTEYIPYEASERASGESKWGFRKLFKYAVEGIISFSTLPLKISTAIGLIFSVLSMIYLVAVVIQKIAFGINVPGFATTIVLILFMGGIQLFFLGILGEYLSKIYIQTKNRPIYIKKKHLGNKNEKNN